MPATKPAKQLQNQEYESVNSLFNIGVGTSLTIQNQGDKACRISLADAKPDVKTKAYRNVPASDNALILIPAGEPEVWMLGVSQIQAEEF